MKSAVSYADRYQEKNEKLESEENLRKEREYRKFSFDLKEYLCVIMIFAYVNEFCILVKSV